jgi:membrane protein
MMFTGMYIIMPNTRVKFKYAIIGGVLAGTAYQAFQYLYIDGQISVSRYNAIYGSFAALPMFLLWLQISWTICLFGASLTFAGQNLQNYNFDKDTRNISRRYKDFITVLIMSLIVKRFENGERPYTAEELSMKHHIPVRLTHQTLDLLCTINYLSETPAEKKSEETRYQPAFDINRMNVASLFERIDTHGSEDFKIDKEDEFSEEWKILLNCKNDYYDRTSKILLKDL